MAILSGATGSVSFKATGGNVVTLDVTEWSIDEGNRVADTTTSAAAYTVAQGTVADNSWSFTLPLDSANTPEVTAAMAVPATGTIWFKIGTSSTYYKITPTTAQRISKVNNAAGDVVRLTVSGGGGALTQYTAVAPA